MAIEREKLLCSKLPPRKVKYSLKDARFYALSIGFGSDPLFEPELDFVSERKSFKTVPTMASIFSEVIIDLTHACKLERPELVLHGQQNLTLFAPLPDTATLEISGSIPAIYDRGEGKGSEIHMQVEARISGDVAPLYRATYVTIARGDRARGAPAAPRRSAEQCVPDRAPDYQYRFPTAPNQALIYSLNGDPNPIHTQPQVARSAGFDAPILHGLCTYGMACRALLATCFDYDSERINQFDVRFSSPVTPGDTLVFEFWRLDSAITFQARNQESERLVLKDGFCSATLKPRLD